MILFIKRVVINMDSTKYKKYVSVEVKVDAEGRVIPLAIIWDDDQRFEIDRVLDVRYAASRKAGGVGTRYTCSIHGQQRYLYWENPQWFVERERV